MPRPAPKRRDRGSIERRGNSLRVKVYAGLDPLTGRRLYLTGSATDEAEAEKIRTRLQADVDAKRHARTRGTLGLALDKWLAVHEVEETTLEGYRGHIERVIRPALGETPTVDVGVQVLEELYADLRRCRNGEPAVDHRTGMPHECRVVKHHRRPGRPSPNEVHDCEAGGCTVKECPPHRCKPMSASGIRQVHWILSSVLAATVRWGWITSNPAEVAKKPREPAADPDPPSTADAARIVDAAWAISADWGMFVWLVFVTGMRRAEVIALRWTHLNLGEGTVIVRRNWVTVTGESAQADPPNWAIDALGPIPDDAAERAVWRERAATVSAHRELTGHTDTAIGAPPAPGQAEAYASWRSAWRALGRPESDTDEMQMSNGRLHLRVRAYEREQAWAPRHVANELAGTIQAATRHRERATLLTTEADTTPDPERRVQLEQQATEAEALADTLDGRVETLTTLHGQRGEWWAHTAGTRLAAERAQAELSARRAGADDTADDRTTAEDWMRAHDEAMRAEDPHREITDESDFTDHTTPTDAPIADLRQVAADEPEPVDENTVRVPAAAETAYSVDRARRALEEIRQRDATDAARESEEHRTNELIRWHEEDQASDSATVDE